MRDFDAIVIGAGLNGLTATAFLARAGLRTCALDQRDRVGGLASPVPMGDGDFGPAILQDTGSLAMSLLKPLRLAEHGLAISHQPAALNVLGTSGERWVLEPDVPRLTASGTANSHRDAEGYARMRAFCSKVAPVFKGLLRKPLPQRPLDWGPLALRGLQWWRSPDMHALLRAIPLSARDFLDEYFEADALKAALAVPALQATFSGPLDPFGALPILLRETMDETHVVGGASALAAALDRAARSFGAEVTTGTAVSGLLLSSGGAVHGVRLESGDTLTSRFVIATCSPKVVYESLLPRGTIGAQQAWQLSNLRSRGSTAHLILELKAPAPAFLPRARMAPGVLALERSFDNAKGGVLPETLAIEVVPDPDATVLSVLVHPVPLSGGRAWSANEREELTSRVVAQLARWLTGPVVRSQLTTPSDIASGFCIPGGHLYHLEQAPDQMLMSHDTPIPRLFLGGNATHPGGGMTCAPGALAARAALRSRS